MSETHFAYLVVTMDGDDESAMQSGIYSEYPLATIGTRNRHQFLIARAAGGTYAMARGRLIEFLRTRSGQSGSAMPPRPLLWDM